MPEVSPWSPLRLAVFRWLWVAGVVSNLGSYLHFVAAGWAMTSLSTSPRTVSLLQAAGTVPGFVMALPAGALADVVDRRRMIVATQLAAMAVAAGLGALAVGGGLTVGLLLGLTFVLSTVNTVAAPAFMALTPDLVGPEELPQAIGLTSVSSNLAQSAGPALAGVLIALAGPGAAFLVNAASFLAVVAVLQVHRAAVPRRVGAGSRPRPVGAPPRAGRPGGAGGAGGLGGVGGSDDPDGPAQDAAAPEISDGGGTDVARHSVWADTLAATGAGVRWFRGSGRARTLAARVMLSFLVTSALAALLPVVARARLEATAFEFGLLSAALGTGAVAVVWVLPLVRAVLAPDRLVAVAAVVWAVGVALFAATHSVPVAAAGLVLAGAGGMATMNEVLSLYTLLLPAWVRGRASSLVMLVIWLGASVGAVAWGSLASWIGPPAALGAAAGAHVVVTAVAWATLGLGTRELAPEPG